MQVPFLSLYNVTKKYKSEIDDAALRVVNSLGSLNFDFRA